MSELRDKSPLCPYCGTPLTVQGHTTHYYLCYACRVAVDPAPPPADLDLYDPEHDPDVVRDAGAARTFAQAKECEAKALALPLRRP